MTKEEALRAIKEKLLVQHKRSGWPNKPYLGFLRWPLDENWFFFEGQSGSEMFVGKVRLEEISIAERE